MLSFIIIVTDLSLPQNCLVIFIRILCNRRRSFVQWCTIMSTTVKQDACSAVWRTIESGRVGIE